MLVRLLEEEDESTRNFASRSLSELGAEAREVLPAVEALTRHRSYQIRKTALQLRRALTRDGEPNKREP
jgi:hypothetical protein